MTMDPLVAEFLGVVVRWLLTAVGMWLVDRHVLTADQSEHFATAFAHNIVLALPCVGGLLWGLLARYRSRIKFLTALDARAGTSEATVKATIKNGMGASL